MLLLIGGRIDRKTKQKQNETRTKLPERPKIDWESGGKRERQRERAELCLLLMMCTRWRLCFLLSPCTRMHMHAHAHTHKHHTFVGVARCCHVYCVGAYVYNGHSYFGQLKQKAIERAREGERERESEMFDKSMSKWDWDHRIMASWAAAALHSNWKKLCVLHSALIFYTLHGSESNGIICKRNLYGL